MNWTGLPDDEHHTLVLALLRVSDAHGHSPRLLELAAGLESLADIPHGPSHLPLLAAIGLAYANTQTRDDAVWACAAEVMTWAWLGELELDDTGQPRDQRLS